MRLHEWLSGTSKPALSEFRDVARRLHRQLATFLLPEPPVGRAPIPQFRHPLGGHERRLNPIERRFVRRAQRLQDAQRWLLGELGDEVPDLPSESVEKSASNAAQRLRARLAIGVEQQIDWRSPSVAFDAWRIAVEQLGVIVVLYPMTVDSCRGFSLYDDTAPLIAVNTAWRDVARIFTLFHEVGHLLTRTNSACAAPVPSFGRPEETAERWCEAFAAAVIIPDAVVNDLSTVDDLKSLGRVADRYHVSLRAMAIRLIGAGKSTWSLYKAIPAAAEDKRRGGAGGTGRNRREIREDEIGHRGARTFVDAVRRDVITETQALDYLDIPATDFERLAQSVPADS